MEGEHDKTILRRKQTK